MRQGLWRAVVGVGFGLAWSSAALAQGSVAGSWEGHITNERGQHIITAAQFVQDGDKVSGDLSMYGSTPMPICDGTFDGQILRFTIDRNWTEGQTCADLNQTSAIRFEGRLKGPSISGTADDGKIKGSLFWIQVEPTPTPAVVEPTPAVVAPTPAVVAPTPVVVAPTPLRTPVPSASPKAVTGGASPYEIARAYITAVRGDDPEAFVAVWNTKNRTEDAAQLRELFGKAKVQCRQIADALEKKLTQDAFRLEGRQALLSYPCTGRFAGKQCVFTVTQEQDGRWYVEDLD
jgi:hypothetical protein